MELRELPPGGREVQLLLGFCSPPGFFLGSLSRHEVRVGGWPAGLPVDSKSRAVLQPCQLTHPHQNLAGAAAARAGSSGPRLDLQKLSLASKPSFQLGKGREGKAAAAVLACASSVSLFPFCFFLCSSHITWDSVLLGLRHLFKYVLGPPEL